MSFTGAISIIDYSDELFKENQIVLFIGIESPRLLANFALVEQAKNSAARKASLYWRSTTCTSVNERQVPKRP